MLIQLEGGSEGRDCEACILGREIDESFGWFEELLGDLNFNEFLIKLFQVLSKKNFPSHFSQNLHGSLCGFFSF
jgi:hypothetical protein